MPTVCIMLRLRGNASSPTKTNGISGWLIVGNGFGRGKEREVFCLVLDQDGLYKKTSIVMPIVVNHDEGASQIGNSTRE